MFPVVSCIGRRVWLPVAKGLPGWLRGKSVCLQCGRPGLIPGSGRFPWKRKWHLTPVFLPGESQGLRSLVGYSPRGRKELDTTCGLYLYLATHAASAVAAKSLQSCPTLCDPIGGRLLHPWDSPGENTGVGCHFLLQWEALKIL